MYANIRLCCLCAILVFISSNKAYSQPKPAKNEGPPPMIAHEIIFAGYLGGKGDQALMSVEVKNDKVMATGPSNKYGLMITLNPDGSFKRARVAGNWAYTTKKKFKGKNTHAAKAIKRHPVKFGFDQVASLLQQPTLSIGKKKLYGWSASQAKKSKGPFAPYMSDSRIVLVSPTPVKDQYFIAGWSDGGNSSLMCLPTDINTPARFNNRLSTNFPNGGSTWCFVYDKTGKQIHPGFRLRSRITDMVYDPWGRPIIWGRGIAVQERTGKNSLNMMPDGGGLMMIDAQFQRRIFTTSIGNDIFDVAYDPETGIFAAVGYYHGEPRKDKNGNLKQPHPFKQVNNHFQDKPGGGYDAYLVVWRMWEARYSPARIKAIEKWKEKEAEKEARSQGRGK